MSATCRGDEQGGVYLAHVPESMRSRGVLGAIAAPVLLSRQDASEAAAAARVWSHSDEFSEVWPVWSVGRPPMPSEPLRLSAREACDKTSVIGMQIRASKKRGQTELRGR